MGKEVKISIEEDHLYIDGKPMKDIYQPADNTYIVTTFPGRYKLVKQDEDTEALVDKEAELGCEYGAYSDGEDRVFYPEDKKRDRKEQHG